MEKVCEACDNIATTKNKCYWQVEHVVCGECEEMMNLNHKWLAFGYDDPNPFERDHLKEFANICATFGPDVARTIGSMMTTRSRSYFRRQNFVAQRVRWMMMGCVSNTQNSF